MSVTQRWLGAVAMLTLGASVQAQESAVHLTKLRVAGHLVRLTVDGEQPIRAGTVTLHRIGQRSGPVDSMQTTSTGAFVFEIDADSSSMYLATARYHGIAYSSPPARLGEANGEFEIVAFDTTSQPLRIAVVGRHVVVSLPDVKGERKIIDVLEIENDSIVTRVAAPGRPVLAVRLPDGAVRPSTSQGDFVGSGVEFVDGEARIVAPVAPGVRQLVLEYVMPASAFPVAMDLTSPVGVLEVLLEEADASAVLTGGTLSAAEPVTTDGRSFRRALSSTVAAGAVLQISAPAPPSGALTGALGIALVSLGALSGLWWWRHEARSRGHASRRETDELLRSISALDAIIADPSTPDAARERLARERAGKYSQAQSRLARRATSD